MATKGKSFAGNDNPALAFISTPDPEQETPAATRKAGKKAEGKKPLQIETRPLYKRGEGEASAAHVKTTDAPEGYKANPLFVETKSRRLQLLVQPSIYEALKEGAKAEGRSVNDYVHTILEKALRG